MLDIVIEKLELRRLVGWHYASSFVYDVKVFEFRDKIWCTDGDLLGKPLLHDGVRFFNRTKNLYVSSELIIDCDKYLVVQSITNFF